MREGPEVGDGPSPAEHRWSRHATIELVLVTLAVLAIRLVDLGRPPFIDEMNHVLAARSLLADGTLTIFDGGAYGRGALFTYLVAGFYAVFGQSLAVARLPAVISGVLLVSLLFAWLYARVGRVAAWTTALLLGFSPVAIYLSQWSRFYTLHALVFWLGAWGVYRLVGRVDHGWKRRWLAAGTAVFFVVAFQLQVTTAVGLAGLGLFAALIEGPRLLDAITSRRGRFATVAVVAVGLLVAAALLEATGIVDWLASRATRVDVWAIERAEDPRFYHRMFSEQYGFLWVLFPVAALLALARNWRLGLLFVSVFCVAVVVHSIAAWKAERYVFYAMPAWFAVWGMAAAELIPWLWQRLEEGSRSALSRVPGAIRRLGILGALVLAGSFAAVGVSAYTTTRVVYVQGKEWMPPPTHRGEQYAGHPDWEAAAERLASLPDEVDVIVGEPDLKVIYYLGDLDFVLYAGYLVKTPRRSGAHDMNPEFGTRWKVGRPMVSSAGSIEMIMACYASGLIVAERHVWGWRGGVPEATAAFIELEAEPVELPAEWGILAFRWRTAPVEDSPRCRELRTVREQAPVQQRGLLDEGPRSLPPLPSER